MGYLSRHFSRWEFACKCAGAKCYKSGDPCVDIGLIEMLQAVRNHFKQTVIITSGSRCVKHNNAIGGATNSFHLQGRAADIKVRFIKPHLVYEYLNAEYPNHGGLGNYPKFTHVDSRLKKSRWTVE